MMRSPQGSATSPPPSAACATTNPEVVYFTAYYPEAGLFLRQMRDAGVDALFIGGNAAINAEFVEIAGVDVAAGSLVTQEPLPTDLPYPEAAEFLAEYVARHGAPPSSSVAGVRRGRAERHRGGHRSDRFHRFDGPGQLLAHRSAD